MDLELNKNEKSGLIGTIVFHLILIILFLFTGMTYLEPPPPEEGILINFGTSNDGSGQTQTQTSTSSKQEVVKEAVEESPQSASSQEELMTQNTEAAPAVETKKEETIKEVEEVVEDPKPSKQLSDAVSKWKNKSDSKSTSDGITGKQGDQGDITGSLESGSYVGGAGGSGFSFNLSGRRMVGRPTIKDMSQEEGKVVVEIVVDKYGKVVRANPGVRGSTTTSQVLYKIAKDAAMSTKFNVNPQAPEQQKGQIVFTFLVKG